MRRLWMLTALLGAAVAVAACSEGEKQQAQEQAQQAMDEAKAAAGQAMDKAKKAADQMGDMADEAMAEDNDGKSADAMAKLDAVGDSGVTGKVTFTRVGDGVQVYAEASGLPKGKHAFHIHENGDCGDNAQAAGGHLKLSTDSNDEIHGNLGEFTVASDGSDSELTMLTVPLSEIMGKAVVVHAKGNDPSQPPGGAAGARIACGIIQ